MPGFLSMNCRPSLKHSFLFVEKSTHAWWTSLPGTSAFSKVDVTRYPVSSFQSETKVSLQFRRTFATRWGGQRTRGSCVTHNPSVDVWKNRLDRSLHILSFVLDHHVQTQRCGGFRPGRARLIVGARTSIGWRRIRCPRCQSKPSRDEEWAESHRDLLQLPRMETQPRGTKGNQERRRVDSPPQSPCKQRISMQCLLAFTFLCFPSLSLFLVICLRSEEM